MWRIPRLTALFFSSFSFWCVCLFRPLQCALQWSAIHFSMGVIMDAYHVAWLCIHFKSSAAYIKSVSNTSLCRFSHCSNYHKPQVDSYVCQSATFFPSTEKFQDSQVSLDHEQSKFTLIQFLVTHFSRHQIAKSLISFKARTILP